MWCHICATLEAFSCYKRRHQWKNFIIIALNPVCSWNSFPKTKTLLFFFTKTYLKHKKLTQNDNISFWNQFITRQQVLKSIADVSGESKAQHVWLSLAVFISGYWGQTSVYGDSGFFTEDELSSQFITHYSTLKETLIPDSPSLSFRILMENPHWSEHKDEN